MGLDSHIVNTLQRYHYTLTVNVLTLGNVNVALKRLRRTIVGLRLSASLNLRR